MDIFNNDWFFLILVLLAGGVLGFIVGRSSNAHYKEQQKISQKLVLAHEALANYKEQVALHFAETAEAVNSLTQSYSNVHAKLRQGASTLCDDPEAGDSLVGLSDSRNREQLVQTQDASPIVSPPIDYALSIDNDKKADNAVKSNTETMLHPPNT